MIFCMILIPLIHKTIPSLVADKGGYHPYLLMWELAWFLKLILADASKPHIHMGGQVFVKRVTGKKNKPEHISWHLLSEITGLKQIEYYMNGTRKQHVSSQRKPLSQSCSLTAI